MNKQEINNHTELLAHIAQLKLQKEERELLLKDMIQETIQSLDQMKMMKSMVRQIAEDNEIKKDLVKIAVGFGLKMLEKKWNADERKKTKRGISDYFLTRLRNTVVEIAPMVILGAEKQTQAPGFDSQKGDA